MNLDQHIEIEKERVSRLESFTTAKNRESVLEYSKENLKFLLELKEARIMTHNPVHYTSFTNKFIHTVTCSCGEITRYKVPLARIEEFECPKKGKHAK